MKVTLKGDAFRFPSNAAVEEAINMKLPLAWLIGQRFPNLKCGSTVEISTTEHHRYRGEIANISLEPDLGEDVKNVVLVNLRKHE